MVQIMATGLFKYFPPDEDKLERFTNGQVYLTPPKYLNDPWDFRLRSEPPTEEQVKKEIGSVLSPEGLRGFHKEASSPSFLEGEAHEQQNGLSERIGLVCLTEKPLDRLMWAHYGESHKGFVAEFRCAEYRCNKEEDRMVATCLTPFGGAMKVWYDQRQPVRKRDGSNIRDVCWTKHELWTYEQEWRVVEDLKKADSHPKHEGFFLLWFKPTDLLRVIIGLKADPKVKFQLRQMLNHKEFEHVRNEEAYINPESRNLDVRPLSW
jgi:hypothetical protein